MVDEEMKRAEIPHSARSESITIHHRDFLAEKKPTSKLARLSRSASQRSSFQATCAHCQLPLMIDIETRTLENRSRAASVTKRDNVCQECQKEKRTDERKSASNRLVKASSTDWTHMGNKIETWFEKARTPDQRVVYNFLEELNNKQEKPIVKAELPADKGLDEILQNLKKYRGRFHSARSPNKFSRMFESSSWRVMRHPSSYQRPVYPRVPGAYGDQVSRDIRTGTVYAFTGRRIGSTFLLHPDWI